MDIEKPNCIGCHHIHADNGNCTAVGGFCTAVPAAYCPLIPELRAENEKLRAEWIIEDVGNGDRRKKCSLCNQSISGWWGRDRFCANCGSPMTDEAVDMVMERMEAMNRENN